MADAATTKVNSTSTAEWGGPDGFNGEVWGNVQAWKRWGVNSGDAWRVIQTSPIVGVDGEAFGFK